VVEKDVQRVIGGRKDRPSLAPDASARFNFVIQTANDFHEMNKRTEKIGRSSLVDRRTKKIPKTVSR
jgi:hypothetical protein